MKKALFIAIVSVLALGGLTVYLSRTPEPAPVAEKPALGAEARTFATTTQNLTGVQFAEVRAKIDPLWKKVDDELSIAYYEKKPFRSMGVLSQDQFEKLSAALWANYEIRFAAEVAKLSTTKRNAYARQGWDSIVGTTTTKTQYAQQRLDALTKEGYVLTF